MELTIRLPKLFDYIGEKKGNTDYEGVSTNAKREYRKTCYKKLDEMFIELIDCRFRDCFVEKTKEVEYSKIDFRLTDALFLAQLIDWFTDEIGKSIRSKQCVTLDTEVREEIYKGMLSLSHMKSFKYDEQEVRALLDRNFDICNKCKEYIEMRESLEELNQFITHDLELRNIRYNLCIEKDQVWMDRIEVEDDTEEEDRKQCFNKIKDEIETCVQRVKNIYEDYYEKLKWELESSDLK